MRTGRPVIRGCPKGISQQVWATTLALMYKHKILESQLLTYSKKLQELRDMREGVKHDA
jgi:hypothetical protein